MSSARIFKDWPAVLMLLLVTAGLFMMHTLGHFTMPPAHSHEHTATSAIQASVIQMPADHEPQVVAAPDMPHSPMGSMVLCVAILGAFAILALVTAFMRRVSALILMIQLTGRRVIDAVRGPPAVSIGLHLADLSVLRT